MTGEEEKALPRPPCRMRDISGEPPLDPMFTGIEGRQAGTFTALGHERIWTYIQYPWLFPYGTAKSLFIPHPAGAYRFLSRHVPLFDFRKVWALLPQPETVRIDGRPVIQALPGGLPGFSGGQALFYQGLDPCFPA